MTAVAYAAGHAELAAYLGVPRIPGGRRNDRRGRRDDRRRAGVPLVQLPSGPGLHGRHRIAAAGRAAGPCWPWSPGRNCCWSVVGGVFVVEAASVIIQVGFYKWRRRRMFRCARCTTTSSSWAGRRTKSSSASGSPPPCAPWWAWEVSSSASTTCITGRRERPLPPWSQIRRSTPPLAAEKVHGGRPGLRPPRTGPSRNEIRQASRHETRPSTARRLYRRWHRRSSVSRPGSGRTAGGRLRRGCGSPSPAAASPGSGGSWRRPGSTTCRSTAALLRDG